MARFSAYRLTYDLQEWHREALYRLLSSVESTDEMRALCRDLFTPSEGVMFMRRVHIVRLLFQGKTYKEIMKSLGVGCTTVKSVCARLARSNGGFETALKRLEEILPEIKEEVLREDERGRNRDGMEALMRKLPGYYWPELMVRDASRHVRDFKAARKRNNDLKKSGH